VKGWHVVTPNGGTIFVQNNKEAIAALVEVIAMLDIRIATLGEQLADADAELRKSMALTRHYIEEVERDKADA